MNIQEHHRKLTHGKGKCSAPLYIGGFPSGFCDNEAYGERPESQMVYHSGRGRKVREDGKYDGYIPALACPAHGGPKSPVHYFQDGTDNLGRPMWCAVRNDFVDLQESLAAFSISKPIALA